MEFNLVVIFLLIWNTANASAKLVRLEKDSIIPLEFGAMESREFINNRS
jgi:hypothetical protein